MQTINFDEITQGGVVRIKDGDIPLLSVIDVIKLATKKNNDYSAQILRNIISKYPEVSDQISKFKFPGRGQRDTPVADMKTINEIIQYLPGPKHKCKLKNTAYIYLIHLAIAKDDIFKVGMTISRPTNGLPNRVKSYSKKSDVIFLTPVPNASVRQIETQIIRMFKRTFKLVQGNEYFQGCNVKMVEIIKNIVRSYI